MGNISRAPAPPSGSGIISRKSSATYPSTPTSDGAASVHKKIIGLGGDWASISPDEYHSPEILANKMFPFPKNSNSVSINFNVI